MDRVLSKKDFYGLIIRDRLPVASIPLTTSVGTLMGELEVYYSPLGILLRASIAGAGRIEQIKIFDKRRGRFIRKGFFCGDNAVELDDGTLVSISGEMSIEDIIGREFMISIGDDRIISRAVRKPSMFACK